MPQTRTSTGRNPLLLIVLAAALAALLGWPYLQQLKEPASLSLGTVSDCDISMQRCTTGTDQQISLQISSRPVQAMAPLTFEVELQNIPAERVMLDLQGVEMYMGLHQVELMPVENGRSWRGELTLAICTSGEMLWRAAVRAQQGGNTTTANFDFKAR